MSSPFGSRSYNSPSPPPYAPVPPPLTPRPSRRRHNNESREETTLPSNQSRGMHAKSMILPCLIFILLLASIWMIRDFGRLREKKRDILDEIQQLQADRDEQRRKLELERERHEKRRRGYAPFWGEARLLTAQCPTDRFRRYEARMYNLLVEDDWYEACMKEPIEIAGRTLTSHKCINRGLDLGVHGYWSIEVNRRECPGRTIWDRVSIWDRIYSFTRWATLAVAILILIPVFIT